MRRSSVGVWLFVLVASAGAGARAQTEDELVAQRHYERGIELYDRGDHAAALASFRASFDLRPSPSSALMLGRTLRELGRSPEAAQELERAVRLARLSGAERHAPTAEAAASELETFARDLARVVVVVRGAGSTEVVTVGGRELRAEELGLPVWVTPGDVDVVVRSEGGAVAETRVRAEAGTETQATLDAAPDSASARGEREPLAARDTSTGDSAGSALPALGFTALGLSAAGWIAFTVLGLLAKEQFDELDAECGGPCPADRADDVDRGRTLEALANIGLGVGLGALALGVTLLLAAPDDPEHADLALRPSGLSLRF